MTLRTRTRVLCKVLTLPQKKKGEKKIFSKKKNCHNWQKKKRCAGTNPRRVRPRGYRFQRPPAERGSTEILSEARLHRGSAERSEAARRSSGGRHYKKTPAKVFADDTNIYVNSIVQSQVWIKIFTLFKPYSGISINYKKTSFTPLGKLSISATSRKSFNVSFPSTTIASQNITITVIHSDL